MRGIPLVLILFAFLALASVTDAGETKSFDGTIRLAGSTTLLPVIADNSLVGLWRNTRPGTTSIPRCLTSLILIYVNGGGSGVGVKSGHGWHSKYRHVLQRPQRRRRRPQLGDHQEILISKDCLAFAVNKKNPLAKLDNLTASRNRQNLFRGSKDL